MHRRSFLAASVSLAGTEGAKVRQSLAAKAAALRTHQLTDAEGSAQAATERMSLPVVLLMAAEPDGADPAAETANEIGEHGFVPAGRDHAGRAPGAGYWRHG